MNIGKIEKYHSVGATEDGRERILPYRDTMVTLKTYGEASGGGVATNFQGYMMSEEHKGNLLDLTLAPLAAEIKSAREDMKNSKKGTPERVLYAEAYNSAVETMAYTKERMEGTMKMYGEAANMSSLNPFQSVTLPWQYLDCISNNARHLINFKNTTTPSIVKQFKRKIVEIDGVDYILPDALKNKTFMSKLIGLGNKSFEYTAAMADLVGNKFNIIEKQSALVGAKPKIDPLIPFTSITGIVVNNGSEGMTDRTVTVIQDETTKADYQSRGTFHLRVSDVINENTTDEYVIDGKINFTTGEVSLQGSAGVKSVTFKTAFSGETLNAMAQPRIHTKDHFFTLKNRMHVGFTFEKSQLAAQMSLENIDGMVEGIAMMSELTEHGKDFATIDKIDETVYGLTDGGTIIKGEGSTNAFFEGEFSQTPDAASGFRPTDSVAWREKMLPDAINKVSKKIDQKFNSKKGMVHNVYGNPNAVRELSKLEVLIGAGETYAGVRNDSDIFSASINGSSYKIVATERADWDENDMANNYLRLVPKSAHENHETLTFYQWISYLTKDGSYRSSYNPLLPAAVLVDNFGLDGIHNIFGQIKFK